jgi:hypothetical protein
MDVNVLCGRVSRPDKIKMKISRINYVYFQFLMKYHRKRAVKYMGRLEDTRIARQGFSTIQDGYLGRIMKRGGF